MSGYLPLLAAWIGCAAGVCPALPRPDLVAQVEAGVLDEARASWWGFDPADATETLQAAIDSGVGRLVIDRMPSPWRSSPLRARSNQEIFFEKGSTWVIHEDKLTPGEPALLSLCNVTNLSLVGNGATLRMERASRPLPLSGESRNYALILLKGARNVRMSRLRLEGSCGTGIRVEGTGKSPACSGIDLHSIHAVSNRFSALRVASAEGLSLTDSLLTASLEREGGSIHLIPRRKGDRLGNLHFRGCRVSGNRGAGVLMDFSAGRGGLVAFSECHFLGNRDGAVLLPPSGARGGRIRFISCRFEQAERNSVRLIHTRNGSFDLCFSRCRITASGGVNRAEPEVLTLCTAPGLRVGGEVRFEDLRIDRHFRRPWLERRGHFPLSVNQVEYGGWGSLNLPDRAPLPLTFDDLCPTRREGNGKSGKTAPYPLSGAVICDREPGSLRKLTPLRLTGEVAYLVYADRGRSLTALARLTSGKGGKGSRGVSIVPASGGTPLLLSELRGDGGIERLSLSLPSRGFYRLTLSLLPDQSFSLLASDMPAALDLSGREQGFAPSAGVLYLPLFNPSSNFSLVSKGEGGVGWVSIEVRRPDRTLFWGRDPLLDTGLCEIRSPMPGLWSCRIGRPESAPFRGYRLSVTEGPGYLFLSDDRYWKWKGKESGHEIL